MFFSSLLWKQGILCLACTALLSSGFSQQVPKRLQAGDAAPDFLLKNVRYPGKNQLTLNDFKGKFLVLDFWTTSCTGCIKSFHKVDSLQKVFKGKVEFLMIGKNDMDINNMKVAEQVFERYRKRYNMTVNHAFDTAIFTKYQVQFVPHLIWIYPDGKIAAITSSGFTSKHFEQFLNREKIQLQDASNEANSPYGTYDYQKKLFINNNGGNDSVYTARSVIAPWDPTVGAALPFNLTNEGAFQAVGIGVHRLFFYAFWNKPWFVFAVMGDPLFKDTSSSIIYECKNKEIFEVNSQTGANLFSCVIDLPLNRRSKENYQQLLQNLLQSTFGLKGAIEEREMPYWKLTASEEAKKRLKSVKHEPMKPLWPNALDYSEGDGFTFTNRPVDFILRAIWVWNQFECNFVDETGIDYPVDFNLRATMTDLDEVRQELKKQGLYLEKAYKKMKVLVIKDADDYLSKTTQ